VDCANADILVADNRESNSELDCEDGTAGCLPDVLLDDDLEFLDEEGSLILDQISYSTIMQMVKLVAY
jgi:hypothetical protein